MITILSVKSAVAVHVAPAAHCEGYNTIKIEKNYNNELPFCSNSTMPIVRESGRIAIGQRVSLSAALLIGVSSCNMRDVRRCHS
jgi:hypothetical protein